MYIKMMVGRRNATVEKDRYTDRNKAWAYNQNQAIWNCKPGFW